MNETEFEEWHQKEHFNQIAVETTFKPTVDIESIQNISLEELVIQNFYRKSYKELKEGNPSVTSDEYAKYVLEDIQKTLSDFPNIEAIKLKYVPANSLLAKAYCLEEPFGFERYKREYVNRVCNERRTARERKEKQNVQKPGINT